MRNSHGVLALAASAYWRGCWRGGRYTTIAIAARRLLPSGKATFAQGILATAPNIGILVGLFGGAVIAEAYGWRTVFLVFGIPGVLLAALIQLTVKEPPKLKAASEVVDQGLLSALKHIVRLPSFFTSWSVSALPVLRATVLVFGRRFLGASALQ